MTIPPHVHTIETKSLRKQDAQNGSNMSAFGRHLTDLLKYVNYEMPAEEANIVYKCQSMNNSPVIRVNLI
jgi:hypothetical protein